MPVATGRKDGFLDFDVFAVDFYIAGFVGRLPVGVSLEDSCCAVADSCSVLISESKSEEAFFWVEAIITGGGFKNIRNNRLWNKRASWPGNELVRIK